MKLEVLLNMSFFLVLLIYCKLNPLFYFNKKIHSLIYTFSIIRLDLNYIANFFLYFFSGSKFRAQLFSMLRCGSKPKARYEPSWVASYNMRTNGTCSNYISSANNDKSISLNNNNNNNNNNNVFSNKNTNSIPNNLSVTNFK